MQKSPSANKMNIVQPCSRSRSCSAPKSHPKSGRSARAATPSQTSPPNPSTSILEVLNSRKAKETAKVMKSSGTFSQVAARPPSPNPLASIKAAIASATANFTAAVKKHQDNFRSLLKSAALGTLVSASKIKRLRADNIALMMTAPRPACRGDTFLPRDPLWSCTLGGEGGNMSSWQGICSWIHACQCKGCHNNNELHHRLRRLYYRKSPRRVPNYIPSQAPSPTRRQGRQ